jgi:lysophospholipase L1-like esterase
MKPSAILFFFVSVFALLLAGALIFPEKGIPLAPNLRLQFISKKEIFPPAEEPHVDIATILKQQKYMTDSVLLAIAGGKAGDLKIPGIDTDSLINSITPIEYPGRDSTLLYPLFKSLRNLSSTGQLIRIMHYGDSQIEDDRMTSLLRNKLQTRFGGSGAGLVPASQLYPYGFSMKQTWSKNWNRHIGFGKKDTTIKHNRYGAMASYCTYNARYRSSYADTAVAWINFHSSPYSYNNTRTFSQCRIFYGQNKEPFLNELIQDDKLVDADILPSTTRLKVIRWKLDSPGNNLKLTFKGQSSPEIYGITLDGRKGVAVDNIPLRGCSGLFFTKLDEQLMRDMYKELNVKCFILQFGGNFVPAGLHSYSGYEKWFASQIRQLQRLCPGVSVLVIGVADMSVKNKSNYITNPNVEKVRDALRAAAFKSGAAFWDMYQAMGGQNSMPAWVTANPPLASGDFVHFNARGAKTIAQMFYDALILEYLRYEKQAL